MTLHDDASMIRADNGTGFEMRRETMKTLLIFVLFAISFNAFQAKAQHSVKLPYIIEGEDTIPVVNLPIVNVTDYGPDYMNNLKAYYRLRFNVIKVYPYARLAAMKVNQLNDTLAKMKTNRERKAYTKIFEKQLREDFGKQIENLSVNQGKIFLKLLDRETGHTSFDIIKEMKGSFNAFVLQSSARIFGHNLKDDYDPEGNDKAIEAIVKQIESGEIN